MRVVKSERFAILAKGFLAKGFLAKGLFLVILGFKIACLCFKDKVYHMFVCLGSLQHYFSIVVVFGLVIANCFF